MTAQTQSAAAEERALAAIIRSSHDAVIAKTVNGIVTAWNLGATLLYGYPAERMLGQSIELTIPPELQDEERARHARVAQGHPESGYQCRRLRADGRPIQVVMSMSPVRDDEGTVVGVATISRPVSDQEYANARFASLLEAAPDAMVCVDKAGRIEFVNAATCAMFGYTRSELIGAALEILIPDDLRETHQQHRAGFFSNPKPRAIGAGLSLQAQRSDGSTFPVEVSLAADETGESLAIAAVRDVTEARKIAAALSESETQLRQLADNVDTVFSLFQIDPLEYLYISPGFQKLTGLSPAELQADPGLPISVIHPDDRERWKATFFEPSHTGLPAMSEHRIIRTDGQVRWVRSFASVVPNPHGLPQRVVTTTEDITDRVEAAHALQQAEATARAANDAKNEFLSRMSHELRTPLNAVLGFGQLLEHHLVETEYSDFARHVVRAGRHLLDLINEVLDIARIESGEMSVSPEPVAIATIVEETALLMQPLATTAGVTLSVTPGPTAGYVLADRQRLRQILLNLISNAVKYNRVGGAVWLSWSADGGGEVSIAVRDDGPGISPELYERLFVPFDRLGAETTGIEGTGVGLTVTRALTELMHGTLRFESAVGKGTTFIVDLPIAQEPTAVIPEDVVAKPRNVGAAGSATLLYIEDNEPNVRVMESVLALRPEWRLIHAGLASLGLELARSQPPDLIMLDVHLPDSSGQEVLAALKADPRTAYIDVVVLSADASSQQIKRLLAVGAAQYVTKPVDLTELLAILDRSAEELARSHNA